MGKAGRVGSVWGSIGRFAGGAARDLADAVLDRRCPGCGGAPPPDREVCDACDARIGRTGYALCLRCLHGDPAEPGVDRGCPRHGGSRLLLSGPRFEPPLDAIVHALKYEGVFRLAPWLASLLAEPPERAGSLGKEYLLVPVPLHPARRARRGFDQAALLAADASGRWGIPMARALVRVLDHEPQARLSGAARRANVAGGFACPGATLVRDRPILLVDDVATTGSTLLAAAAALERAKAAWVLALTAAHGGAPEDREAPANAAVAVPSRDVVR